MLTALQVEQHHKAVAMLVARMVKALEVETVGDVFEIAGLYCFPQNEASTQASDAYSVYIDNGELVPWMDTFCIDYMRGTIQDIVIMQKEPKKARKKTSKDTG